MLKLMKLMVPAAALALLIGFQAPVVQAEDTPAPSGKASITVAVVNGEGKPVAGARVALMPPRGKRQRGGAGAAPNAAQDTPPANGGGAGGRQRPKPIAEGKTDENGKAVLTGIADGTYTVAAMMRGEGGGRAEITIANGKDADVTVTLKPRPAGGGGGGGNGGNAGKGDAPAPAK